MRCEILLPTGGAMHMSNEMKIDSREMNIDLALANLEAGKFSFRMVDAIKDHIDKLETELNVARGLHTRTIRELKLRDYANCRLEAELKKLNVKIFALLRANLLTEKTCRQTAAFAIQMAEYFKAFRKYVGTSLETTIADVRDGKFSFQMADVKDQVEVLRGLLTHALLKANVLTRKAYREMTPLAIKTSEFFETSRYSGASLEIAAVKSGKFSVWMTDVIKDDVEFLRGLLGEKAYRGMAPLSVKMGEFVKKYAGSSFEKATACLSALHKTASWQKPSNGAGRDRISRPY
jgi:hypothetical protein